VWHLENGDVLYYAAAVGIAHQAKSNTQRLLIGHEDDILAMALHPNKKTVATGDQKPRPSLIIWDAVTGEKLIEKKQGFAKGIDALQFSHSGKFLMAGCMNDDHNVYVFDTADNKYTLLATEKGGKEFILSATWLSDDNFVTVGLKHYCLWTFGGSSLKSSKGQFGKYNNMLLSSAKTASGDVVCGTALGELQVWKQVSCVKATKAHSKMLDAILVFNDMYPKFTQHPDRRRGHEDQRLEREVRAGHHHRGRQPRRGLLPHARASPLGRREEKEARGRPLLQRGLRVRLHRSRRSLRRRWRLGGLPAEVRLSGQGPLRAEQEMD
jgi:hypothetical protein